MTAIPKAQVKYWGTPSVRFSAPAAVGTSGQYLQTQADGSTDWATVDLSGYVPYTGASSAVDLGTQVLSAGTAKLGLGSMAAPSLSFSSDTDTGIYNQYGDQLRLVIGGSDRLAITTAVIASYLPVRTDVIYGINNVVDFRNSTNPQAFRLANTYTSSTNYEALQFKANTTQYEISSIVGSAGGSNRALAFGHTDSAGTFTSALSIATTGEIIGQRASSSSPVLTLQRTGAASNESLLQVCADDTYGSAGFIGIGHAIWFEKYGGSVWMSSVKSSAYRQWEIAVGSQWTFNNTTAIGWDSTKTYVVGSADMQFYPNAAGQLDLRADNGMRFRNLANTADAPITAGAITASGKASLAASTTSAATLNIPSGTAPTTPNDGDIWSDGSDLKIHLSGVTYTLQKA